jgi:hypothetical protein
VLDAQVTEPTALQPPVPGAAGKLRKPKVKPPRFAPDPNTPVEPDWRCNARTKGKDHHLCDQPAGTHTDHPGSGRCWFHGGKTPSGPTSPHWKDGHRSKAAREIRSVLRSIRSPERRQAVEEALADPQLLELREEVAILRRFRDEALERLGTQESGAAWHAAATAFRALRKAIQDVVVTPELTEAIAALDATIRDGAQHFAQEQDVIALAHHRARLVESERQRLVQEQQVLTARGAETLMAMLEAAVRKHVSDPATLDAIGQELARAVGAGPGAAVPLIQ